MFCLEYAGTRPPGSAAFYCLCIREPYTLGRHEENDIVIDCPSVSRHHCVLTVALSTLPPLFASPPPTTADNNKDAAECALSLTVTNVSKYGTRVDDRVVTGSCNVVNGSLISLGVEIKFRCTYRPLVVALAPQYSDEYITELRESFVELGSECIDFPTPHNNASPKPILEALCAEEIDNSPAVLHALGLGYSIVRPAFVVEWFAAVAEDPACPLHQLPHPSEHNPLICQRIFGGLKYLRPEPNTCAYFLHAAPSLATNRDRQSLFSRRIFCVKSQSRELGSLLRQVITMCGGRVVDEFELAAVGESTSCYVVLDEADFEASCLAPDLDDAETNASSRWLKTSEKSIYAALLTNKFAPVTMDTLRSSVEQQVLQPLPQGAPSTSTTEVDEDQPAPECPPDAMLEKAEKASSDATPSNCSTPSEVSSDEPPEDDLVEVVGQKGFEIIHERVRRIVATVIAPAYVQVQELYEKALRHHYLSAGSLRYVSTVHGKAERFLQTLEEISQTPEGNNHSNVLRRYWDTCEKLVECIKVILSMDWKNFETSQSRGVNKSPMNALNPFVPHVLSPTVEQIAERSTEPISRKPLAASAAESVAQPPVALRHGTCVARYYPPAPVKARINVVHKKAATSDDADLQKAKLLIFIPPTDLRGIWDHHRLYLRKFGAEEGDARFNLWMSSQTAEWGTQFHHTLEDKNLTMRAFLNAKTMMS